LGYAGISRGTEQLINFGALPEFPGDGMLSAAAADN
jgi:hypothetical protein